MKLIKRVLSLVLTFIVITIALLPEGVQALTIDNDGKAKDKPYGDSKLPKSYVDVDYYDCYLPYNVTIGEIGGYSDSIVWYNYPSNPYNWSMKEKYPNYIKQKFTARCMYEGDALTASCLKNVLSRIGYKSLSMEKEGSHLNVVTDANGNKYYITAVQDFFWNFGGLMEGKDSFPKECKVGQLFDVILTDGTVIHFVVGDSNATAHTNGGPGSRQDGITYGFAPMKLKQYKNLFSACNGNCLELWGNRGCTTEFKKKYNLYDEHENESGNKIAYYRMYNAMLKDSPKRESSVGTDVSYKLGVNGVSSSSEGGSSSSTIVAEWELAGMPEKSQITEQQSDIKLPDRSGLSVGENYSVSIIKDNLAIDREASIFDKVRIFIVFLGLILITYAVFLFVAMVFDMINVFFDISLVKILTFGLLEYCPYEKELGNATGKTNTSKLVISITVILLVGMFLVSGGILSVMSNIMYTFSKKFL